MAGEELKGAAFSQSRRWRINCDAAVRPGSFECRNEPTTVLANPVQTGISEISESESESKNQTNSPRGTCSCAFDACKCEQLECGLASGSSGGMGGLRLSGIVQSGELDLSTMRR